ncbi:MAG TPA: DUF5702 domain-containing protein [Clostridia bacterium]|nr:DUF5702 domain-containing protein [Clostridia bacterium]
MKHYGNNKKGIISVFVAIVLPVILILSLVLSDIYIAKNASDAAKNALKASCGCVLSQYSSFMQNEYGLYGYTIDDGKAYDIVFKALDKSSISTGIYKMDIQNIEVTKTNPIYDYSVLSSQVFTLMKDDIYKDILIEVNEKIDIFKKMKDVLKTLNIKMQVDELVGGLKNVHEKLKTTIEQINSSSYYQDLIYMIESVDYIVHNIHDLIDNAENIDNVNAIELLKEEALEIININIDNLVYVLKEYNKQGLNLISQMVHTYAQVHILSDSMRRIVSSIKDCPEYLEVFLEICIDTVYSMENSFSNTVFDQIERTFDRNLKCLENALKDITEAVISGSEQPILYVFNDAMEEYYDVVYNPELLDSFFFTLFEDNNEDKRGFWKEYAKNMLNSLDFDDNTIDSFIALISDDEFLDFTIEADMTGNTSKSIFLSIDDICSMLSKLEEDIYFNEYLMLYLNSITDSEKNVSKSKYLKGETEYIIFGNRDNSKNIKSCEAAITALRFALNIMHVYTDIDKTTKANVLAASLAGSLSFGAATPIAKNLILCSWAFAEAAYDTNTLKRGEKCPLFKLDGDWNIDIGIDSGFNKTPDWLKMDYEDYIRVLMCTTSNDQKTKKLLDLISINCPYVIDMSQVYCGINVKAVLSYEGIFGIKRIYKFEVSDAY